jgi:hypothetical protein
MTIDRVEGTRAFGFLRAWGMFYGAVDFVAQIQSPTTFVGGDISWTVVSDNRLEAYDPDRFRRSTWAPALTRAGLKHVLGHASVKITLDRYGHLFPDEKRGAATRLEAQLAAARSSSIHPAEEDVRAVSGG